MTLSCLLSTQRWKQRLTKKIWKKRTSPKTSFTNDQGASERKSWRHRFSGASTRFQLQFLEINRHVYDLFIFIMIWRETFKYISIHRCVLISCTAVNHPYDYVLWYCSRWRGCLLRASYFHQDSHQVRWHGGSCEKYRRHATSPTSQPLVARWHDFKSIKVARNLILVCPSYARMSQIWSGYPQKQANASKLILHNDARNNFDFASFWEDPYL